MGLRSGVRAKCFGSGRTERPFEIAIPEEGKRVRIPGEVVPDSVTNQNAGRFPTEPLTTSNGMLDRFLWNHRTTSTGIRTREPGRCEAGSWMGLRSGVRARGILGPAGRRE